MKIITWNLANYDDHSHWEIRRKLIVKEIARHQPDVLALQEIRYNSEHPSTQYSHLNMAEQILMDLQNTGLYQNARIINQPAMYYRFPIWWEGVSIISVLPITETGGLFHALLPDSPDPNKRITQYTLLQKQNANFFIFNTHFSYEESCLATNVNEAIEYLNRFASCPCLLVGDLNAEPQNKNMQKLALAGYTDVWKMQHPDENGFTHKPIDPSMRIDYCWVNNLMKDRIKSIEIIGKEPDENGLYPSDHLGLLLDCNL
ncbi:MAG TPA: endonuclease/exonuclease/phosphatase family protein [Candidatus Cloacimonadota bacterium]|nr:endonuclease/exonuclease/phosphatase family protein [Candidatus Cloacimonadota bacterium]